LRSEPVHHIGYRETCDTDFDELVGSDIDADERDHCSAYDRSVRPRAPPSWTADAASTSSCRWTLRRRRLARPRRWPSSNSTTPASRLAPATPFQLWLTREGEREALCGAFVTSAAGSAIVPMNAPYRFDEFDGWVVVEEGSETTLLTT
jgi:hypothetical protein